MISRNHDRPDLAAVKVRQQNTWASGDFSVVAARIVLVSEQLADGRPSYRLERPRRRLRQRERHPRGCAVWTHAMGVDYVPALLEDGRARAWPRVSTSSSGWATRSTSRSPRTRWTRRCRSSARCSRRTTPVPRRRSSGSPGLAGTVGLASWTPDGFIGQMFRVISAHVAPPAGVAALLWGTEDHLAELFGSAAGRIRSVERTVRSGSRRPGVRGVLPPLVRPDPQGVRSARRAGPSGFAADLTDLGARFDRHRDGGSVAIPATYLESVLTLR